MNKILLLYLLVFCPLLKLFSQDCPQYLYREGRIYYKNAEISGPICFHQQTEEPDSINNIYLTKYSILKNNKDFYTAEFKFFKSTNFLSYFLQDVNTNKKKGFLAL